jgi:hypothetical protein
VADPRSATPTLCVAAPVINLTKGSAPITVAGIGAGLLLLGYSIMALIGAVRT